MARANWCSSLSFCFPFTLESAVQVSGSDRYSTKQRKSISSQGGARKKNVPKFLHLSASPPTLPFPSATLAQTFPN
ncbi:uncharacterized protein K444DRAFT_612251, partial [Hyaloscypha bicolor E]